MYYTESTITMTCTLREGLLEHWRLHRSLCALVEVKDFLGSCTRCSLKNCFIILHAVFFNQFHRYDNMVLCWSSYPMIVTCWWLRWLKRWPMTQMVMGWRFCDDPDNHWWRSCDSPSDDLKTTLTTQKMTGDYIVTILLMNSWWP